MLAQKQEKEEEGNLFPAKEQNKICESFLALHPKREEEEEKLGKGDRRRRETEKTVKFSRLRLAFFLSLSLFFFLIFGHAGKKEGKREKEEKTRQVVVAALFQRE